jgi:hypothetical protein
VCPLALEIRIALTEPHSQKKDLTMHTQNLSSVATDLIQTYGNTAKNIVNAYRVGNERVAGIVEQRWETALSKSAKQLGAEVRNNALSAEKKISAYYIKGITLYSDGADLAINRAVQLAAKGVQQVAVSATKFEKATGNKTLNKIAVAAVPAVVAVSKLAEKIEARSTQLVKAAAGGEVAATVALAKRRTRTRKTA